MANDRSSNKRLLLNAGVYLFLAAVIGIIIYFLVVYFSISLLFVLIFIIGLMLFLLGTFQVRNDMTLGGTNFVDKLLDLAQLLPRLKNRKGREAILEPFNMSISHPRLLSKRYSSPFIVNIFLPDYREEVERKLKNEFGEKELTEHMFESKLVMGLTVNIKLFSPEIKFSSEIVKELKDNLNTTNFVAKPDDACYPGTHTILLSVSDKKTGHEYESRQFSVRVVDYAFDHVSRPFVSTVSSVILGIGSLTTFTLTLLGQIDTTVGVTSGTAAGTLASLIYTRFLALYRRPNATSD